MVAVMGAWWLCVESRTVKGLEGVYIVLVCVAITAAALLVPLGLIHVCALAGGYHRRQVVRGVCACLEVWVTPVTVVYALYVSKHIP